jgi:hypothetical protein
LKGKRGILDIGIKDMAMVRIKQQRLEIIFLEGSHTGPKLVKLRTWDGKAFFSPSANLLQIIRENKFKNDGFDFSAEGIYFLKYDPRGTKHSERVYIGKANILGNRIKKHFADDKKDFNELIAFSGSDLNIEYLEAALIEASNDAKNAEIDTKTKPDKERWVKSTVDRDDMEFFIEKIKIILPIMGSFCLENKYPVFDKNAINSAVTYHLTSKDIEATLIESSGEFIVLKDSTAKSDVKDGLIPGWKNLRENLIDSGILKPVGSLLKFTQNTKFNSLSAAASVILGSQTNGKIAWKVR